MGVETAALVASEVVAAETVATTAATAFAAETATTVAAASEALGAAEAAGLTAEGMLAGEAAGTVATAAEAGTLAAGELIGDAAITGAAEAGESLAAQTVAGEGVGAGQVASGAEAASDTGKLAQDILNPATGSGAPADVTTRAEQTFLEGAKAGAPVQKQGIVQGVLDWIKENKTAALIGGQTIAGAVGGVGKASLEKEIAKRNIEANKQLLAQKTDEQLRMSREGTYRGGAPVVPSGQTVLYRPDGTPVYITGGGIINNQIARG